MLVSQLICTSLRPTWGYCGQRNFIAAQTPMRNTEGDVWEMIWMEKCAAVVVLCDSVEGKDVSRQCTKTHTT